MAFYVGGDTTELEYDFYTKTAGSTVGCPMKIYKGEVDPNALPSPTDVLWKEITSQSVIDKLKSQNEILTSNLSADKSTIQWGDKTLAKTSTIKIVDDFVGKIMGSVLENPNIAKYQTGSSLLIPSNVNWREIGESGTLISKINILDGQTQHCSTGTGNTFIPQQLFSFNLIEIVERKFGTIPKETVAEKVEWLKSNLKNIRCDWHGYGSCPSGNKAYFVPYLASNNTWDSYWTGIVRNTSSSSTLVIHSLGNTSTINFIAPSIDSNGFVHFLAYTDPSDGVTPSTIYTDYISIELTLKAPENLITATNTSSDIVTDFIGKISGSVAENANVFKVTSSPSSATALLIPSSASFLEGIGSLTPIKTLDGNCNSSHSNANGTITQQLFSFNIVQAVEKHLGQPIPAVDKVQWCKDNLNKTTFAWNGYGSCPSGNKAYIKMWYPVDSNYYGLASTTSSTVANLAISPDTMNYIDNNGFIHFLAYTDPSNGVTASTIYTDYVKLTIKLKHIPTYDFYTESNNRRDAGLTNIVMVKRNIADMTSDFTGKINGSVVENPNIAKTTFNSVLQTPSGSWLNNDLEQSGYDNIKTLNSTNRQTITWTNGLISQQLFSFNLIAIAEKQLGTSIPGADTASKIQWLKDNLNSIKCDWWGYGSCPTGNKAKLNYWNSITQSYPFEKTHSSSSVANIQILHTDISKIMDTNGFTHFLAYTDPSDGNTASVINTDYVKITLTFKTDTVGYEFFTNDSSEISVTTNNKASAFLIECDLTPIATALYGGSNSALKSALKSIEASAWAMGSGANVNQLGYGCKLKMWANGATIWSNVVANIYSSNSGNISKVYDGMDTQANCAWFTTSTNKFYVIVYSTYKSDGTIASEVNLDYVNIKVKLTRTPDVIAPIPIELGDTWSILLKGVSPSWDSTDVNAHYLLSMSKDDNNKHALFWASNKKFAFQKKYNGVWGNSLSKDNEIFSKYQITNLIISQKHDGMYFQFLTNNKTIVTMKNTDANFITGMVDLILLTNFTFISNKADAFLENLYLFNNKVFTDEEAEVMLRGRNTIVGKENDTHLNELAEMFKNPNLVPLFNDGGWTKHPNATVSADGKTLTLNATASWQTSTFYVPILPNNKYKIKITAPSSSACLRLDEYCGSYVTRANNYRYGTGEIVFTTHDKTRMLRIVLQNAVTGTFTFSDLELRRLD